MRRRLAAARTDDLRERRAHVPVARLRALVVDQIAHEHRRMVAQLDVRVREAAAAVGVVVDAVGAVRAELGGVGVDERVAPPVVSSVREVALVAVRAAQPVDLLVAAARLVPTAYVGARGRRGLSGAARKRAELRSAGN